MEDRLISASVFSFSVFLLMYPGQVCPQTVKLNEFLTPAATRQTMEGWASSRTDYYNKLTRASTVVIVVDPDVIREAVDYYEAETVPRTIIGIHTKENILSLLQLELARVLDRALNLAINQKFKDVIY